MPKNMSKNKTYTPIYRSEENKILAGVCGGLGEYFNVDPNIIRIIFIILTIFGGSGLIIYLVLWIILPSKLHTASGKNPFQENMSEVRTKAQKFAHDIQNSVNSNPNKRPSNRLLAYGAILLGIIFLLNNFGFNDLINFDRLWPILLILLGGAIILRK